MTLPLSLALALAVATLTPIGCTEAPHAESTGAGGAASTSAVGGGAPAESAHLQLHVEEVVLAEEGEPCGTCFDLLEETATAACTQASLDLFYALQSCSCGACGVCKVACSEYVAPNMTLQPNACEGAEPSDACKACLVATSIDGCGAAWNACLADLPPPEPLPPCSAYDAPTCAGGEEIVDCNGDAVCPEATECAVCCVDQDAVATPIAFCAPLAP